jgi:hypothetical protein
MDDVRVGRALLNGLFVWLISLVLYLLPAFLLAFWLGAQLGPGAQDYAALGQEISKRVSTMYTEQWVLTGGAILITAILILWRARAVSKGTWNMRWLNGLLVGLVPAVLSLLFALCGGFGIQHIVLVVVYLGAGLLAGVTAQRT